MRGRQTLSQFPSVCPSVTLRFCVKTAKAASVCIAGYCHYFSYSVGLINTIVVRDNNLLHVSDAWNLNTAEMRSYAISVLREMLATNTPDLMIYDSHEAHIGL